MRGDTVETLLTLDDFDALAGEQLRAAALGVASESANSVRRGRAVRCGGEESVDDRKALRAGRADDEDELLVGRHDCVLVCVVCGTCLRMLVCP